MHVDMRCILLCAFILAYGYLPIAFIRMVTAQGLGPTAPPSGPTSTTFLTNGDTLFVPVSQVQFTIDLPDGNTTDAQLLEFECTERSNSGYITVGGTTYAINCTKPLMRVPLTELGRIPRRVELHSNVATIAPDSAQYVLAKEYARAQAKAKADDQISTNPAARQLLSLNILSSLDITGELKSMKKDIEYAKRTAEKALSLGQANSDRLNVHDQDIAMLSTILTGSSCTKPNCIGGGGVIGQLARSNLTQTLLLNRTEILQQQADSLQAQLVLQQNATQTILQRVNNLAQSTANATQDLARQVNANLRALQGETNTQIVAIYAAMNATQDLINTIRVSGDNDFEYIYTKINELQDSAINSYSKINSLTTHKALRDVITQVFFDDLATLDPELIPLLKDSGISPSKPFDGPDTRITIESVDMCFTIAGSLVNSVRVVCQTYNIYSNVYFAIESAKDSVNYKHLLNSMGPVSCARPYIDALSPTDFDNLLDLTTTSVSPCNYYAEVVERSCELPSNVPFDFRTQNATLGPNEQSTNIATICQQYSAPVTVTDSSTQGKVLRTSTELSDYIRDRACMKTLVTPLFYTRFYQTGATMIIPQHLPSCNITLSQMERLALRKQAIPLYMAFGTGWKLGWLQTQKFVSTLSLKLRGRMPGGVSNTDINYMPWTPTRVNADGSPVLDGGADAIEQWTIYWLAVTADTIPVFAAQSTGSDSVRASATVSIVSSDTCNPTDPTCYSKQLQLSVKDISLDAATYAQFPQLPYVYIGNLDNAAFDGMYDVPSNLISAGFDPSIQVNKVTCLLMPPGTNRTLDIQYFWDTKGTLYDPKTCGIDPSQFRYDAFITADGNPYCNINGGSPVEYNGKLYPSPCNTGFNYTASGLLPIYATGLCSSQTLCKLTEGCLYSVDTNPYQMFVSVSNDISIQYAFNEPADANQNFYQNLFAVEFWMSYTNNTVGEGNIMTLRDINGQILTILDSDFGTLTMTIYESFGTIGANTYSVSFGKLSGWFPPSILDIPLHFVLQVHGTSIRLFVNGALRYEDVADYLFTMDRRIRSVAYAKSITGAPITTQFIYGARFLRYDRMIDNVWSRMICGPYSSKGSGCVYSPSNRGASVVIAEQDTKTSCSLPAPVEEYRLFDMETGYTIYGAMTAIQNFDMMNLVKQGTGTERRFALSFIDLRMLSVNVTRPQDYSALAISLPINGTYFNFEYIITTASQMQFRLYWRGQTRLFTTTSTFDSFAGEFANIRNSPSVHIFVEFTLRVNNIFGTTIAINGRQMTASFVTTTATVPPLPLVSIPSYITRMSYYYIKTTGFTLSTYRTQIFNNLVCQSQAMTTLPSAYAADLSNIYSRTEYLYWQLPIGQCIMSTTLPNFGYCRTPSMCGGRCQAWSFVNSTSRSFVPFSHICDNGYAPPDCVRPCSRKDPTDGYCIDQYYKATSKNGFAPTSSHCATARTAGMTTLTTNTGKFLVATPYEWRQTFKVVIPSGKINIKAAQSVCPTVSSASQRADGKITVAMTNSADTDTRISVAWFPTNPAASLTVDPECVNVSGNIIQIRARSVGYFYLPNNGCGNLTIILSAVTAFSTSECSRLTTQDVALIVNTQDVTASFSPVVTKLEVTQTNIVQGFSTAIDDLTKNLINAFTNMISLIDTSNKVRDYAQVLTDNINNKPGVSYNPNVTVTTNFSDPVADAKLNEIFNQMDAERQNFERLKNQSIQATIQYGIDSNNVNVTKFLLNLVGDSIFKGFNTTSSRPGFNPLNPYPDQCGSSSSGGSFSVSSAAKRTANAARQLLQFGGGFPDLPGGLADAAGVDEVFNSFSQLMCGVSVAASSAVTLATDGTNAAKDAAESAVSKAEDAASKGLDIFSNPFGDIGGFFKKILSALVYVGIGVAAIAVTYYGSYFGYKAYKNGSCGGGRSSSSTANGFDDVSSGVKKSKKSNRVGDSSMLKNANLAYSNNDDLPSVTVQENSSMLGDWDSPQNHYDDY